MAIDTTSERVTASAVAAAPVVIAALVMGVAGGAFLAAIQGAILGHGLVGRDGADTIVAGAFVFGGHGSLL